MLRIRSTAPDRRTLRRHTGRIIYVNYATFSFPVHTRVASRPKNPARILTTFFGPPATLRAETETFCSPGDARGGGLTEEVKRPRLINGRGAWPFDKLRAPIGHR